MSWIGDILRNPGGPLKIWNCGSRFRAHPLWRRLRSAVEPVVLLICIQAIAYKRTLFLPTVSPQKYINHRALCYHDL